MYIYKYVYSTEYVYIYIYSKKINSREDTLVGDMCSHTWSTQHYLIGVFSKWLSHIQAMLTCAIH